MMPTDWPVAAPACSGSTQPSAQAVSVIYFSTLPIKAMARAVREAGIAVAVSQTAGTFVCNQVFYRLQHELAGSGVRSGFIHVSSQLGEGLVDGLRIAVSTAWNTSVDVVEVGGQVS